MKGTLKSIHFKLAGNKSNYAGMVSTWQQKRLPNGLRMDFSITVNFVCFVYFSGCFSGIKRKQRFGVRSARMAFQMSRRTKTRGH